MPRKPTKKTITLQTDFLSQCSTSLQTLEEVMDGLDILPETLALWLTEATFRQRLHGTRRFLRRTRDMQIEMGSRHAANILSRCVTDTSIEETKPLQRLASVDLIRLARDSRARAMAANPHPDNETKNAALYHPGVGEDEAETLMRELSSREGICAAQGASK